MHIRSATEELQLHEKGFRSTVFPIRCRQQQRFYVRIVTYTSGVLGDDDLLLTLSIPQKSVSPQSPHLLKTGHNFPDLQVRAKRMLIGSASMTVPPVSKGKHDAAALAAAQQAVPAPVGAPAAELGAKDSPIVWRAPVKKGPRASALVPKSKQGTHSGQPATNGASVPQAVPPKQIAKATLVAPPVKQGAKATALVPPATGVQASQLAKQGSHAPASPAPPEQGVSATWPVPAPAPPPKQGALATSPVPHANGLPQPRVPVKQGARAPAGVPHAKQTSEPTRPAELGPSVSAAAATCEPGLLLSNLN